MDFLFWHGTCSKAIIRADNEVGIKQNEILKGK